ncbi:MAG: hypothetical protein GYA36_22180 [Veillonellaceae bacterium]|nr:hypothetical protein [Veillonellaceae bacterium]
MKKYIFSVFSFLLVITLLLGSFGIARAAADDDPVVTPISGDNEFATEVIAIASLPGTYELATQMLAPVGFPAGETQFGGNGVRVSGLSTGKASACFTLSTAAIDQGWGGKVGVWNGTKWVLLPTTITALNESPNSLACATITGDGTYAFIKYIVAPDKLPRIQECGEMSIAGPYTYEFDNTEGWMSEGAALTNFYLPPGTEISYKIIHQDPLGFFYSGTEGTGVINISGELMPGYFISLITFDPIIEFTYDYYTNLNSFVFRVYFPNCYTDFVYPDDLKG